MHTLTRWSKKIFEHSIKENVWVTFSPIALPLSGSLSFLMTLFKWKFLTVLKEDRPALRSLQEIWTLNGISTKAHVVFLSPLIMLEKIQLFVLLSLRFVSNQMESSSYSLNQLLQRSCSFLFWFAHALEKNCLYNMMFPLDTKLARF